MRSFYTSLMVLSLLPGCAGSIGSTDGGQAGSGGALSGTGGTSSSGTGGTSSSGTGGTSSSGTGGTSSSGRGGSSAGAGGRGGGQGGRGGGAGGAGGAGARGGRGGSSAGGAAGTAAGQVIFVGDFETGNLSQWPYVERCQTDRIQVYSTANAPAGAPAPRGGKYAALFHVLDTDVAPCTSTDNPRAELDSPPLFHSGDDRWEAWSVYVPTSHPTCTNCPAASFFCFQEDYGSPFDGSPSIGWFLDLNTTPNKFSMDRGDQYNHDQPWVSNLVTGQWVDFLVHKVFSNTNDGKGLVEAWVNGAPLTFSSCNCTTLSTQTMHSTQTELEFYLTAYRDVGMFSSFDIYYDEARVGTTRASVELPPQ